MIDFYLLDQLLLHGIIGTSLTTFVGPRIGFGISACILLAKLFYTFGPELFLH